MYIQFLCNEQKNVFNLDKAYTAKSCQLNSVFKISQSSSLNEMNLFVRFDFIGNHNYKTFHNLFSSGMPAHAKPEQNIDKVINIGNVQNGKNVWNDLYLQLIDPTKHEAIHIPQQVTVELFYNDAYNELKPVADAHIRSIGIILEIDPVNK